MPSTKSELSKRRRLYQCPGCGSFYLDPGKCSFTKCAQGDTTNDPERFALDLVGTCKTFETDGKTKIATETIIPK